MMLIRTTVQCSLHLAKLLSFISSSFAEFFVIGLLDHDESFPVFSSVVVFGADIRPSSIHDAIVYSKT